VFAQSEGDQVLKPKTPKPQPWVDFEKRVAEVFRLYGFFPTANTSLAGRQVDILLTSSEEFVGPVVVECKYHAPASGARVGVEEVEAFAAFVLRLRSSGSASAGYLVSSSGFTADARGAIRDRPEDKFVFLRTIEELLAKIVRFDMYLARAVEEFERDPLFRLYEPVSVRDDSAKVSRPFDDAIDLFLARNDTPTVLMLGDYGAGKTSSSRHLFYRLAKQALKGQGGRIPLYIPLKMYNYTGTAESLINKFLADSLALSRPTFSVFDALNNAGLLFLILDGFDEMARRVTQRVRNEAFRSLGALICEESKVLITGRPTYFPMNKELLGAVTLLQRQPTLERLSREAKEDLDSDYKVSIVTVEPLSDAQVTSFLGKRIRLSETDEKAAAKKTTAVVSMINRVYNLNELARRPILLEMISKTIGKPGSKRVKTATDLYTLYTDAWLDIEAEKGEFRTLLSREDRLIFTLKVAWSLLMDQKQEIHFDSIAQLVTSHFDLEEADDVDYFSSDVRTCGFLERTDQGLYSFAHKSFLEFFAARAISAQMGFEGVHIEFEGSENITLANLEATMPNLFPFLKDLIGVPVAPSYWRAVEGKLEGDTEFLSRTDPDVDMGLGICGEMAKGFFSVAELADSLEEIRRLHKDLVTTTKLRSA
jgi:hypothetical protein